MGNFIGRFVGASSLSMCLGLSLSLPGFADEGVKVAGPVGFVDMRAALLPPPGLYLGGAFFGFSAPRYYDDTFGAFGGSVPADIHTEGAVGTLIYVWDANVFGGHVASTAIGDVNSFCVGLPTLGVKTSCSRGLDQPYIEPVAWNYFSPSADFVPPQPGGPPPIPYGVGIIASFGFSPAIGQYNAAYTPVNNAVHYWVLAPGVGFTYTFKA